jgi:crotonyl-CoA reductase
VAANAHLGKVGVLCLAEGEGEGVLDDALRLQHLSGITRFRS